MKKDYVMSLRPGGAALPGN